PSFASKPSVRTISNSRPMETSSSSKSISTPRVSWHMTTPKTPGSASSARTSRCSEDLSGGPAIQSLRQGMGASDVEDGAVEARLALRDESSDEARATAGSSQVLAQRVALFRDGTLVPVQQHTEESGD